MFILENEVLPNSTPTTKNLGLSLFWSDSSNSSVFFIADSQVNSKTFNTPSYKTIIVDDPVPTRSQLLIFKGLVEITDFSEVKNLFLLDNSKYFRDYLEEFTYVVVDGDFGSLSGKLVLTLKLSDFDIQETDSIYLNLDFSNSIYAFNDILTFEAGGFLFTKNSNDSLEKGQFYFNSEDKVLKVRSSKVCGVTSNSNISVSVNISESQKVFYFDCLRFQYENTNLSFIDSVSYENRIFYRSNEIESNTVIYNRINKVALCLL